MADEDGRQELIEAALDQEDRERDGDRAYEEWLDRQPIKYPEPEWDDFDPPEDKE